MFLIDPNKTAGVTAPADPFSLEALIAWLRTKDAETEYCYLSTGNCLIGQYLKERCGFRDPSVGGTYYRASDGECIPLSIEWRKTVRAQPFTFGAALARALEIKGAE